MISRTLVLLSLFLGVISQRTRAPTYPQNFVAPSAPTIGFTSFPGQRGETRATNSPTVEPTPYPTTLSPTPRERETPTNRPSRPTYTPTSPTVRLTPPPTEKVTPRPLMPADASRAARVRPNTNSTQRTSYPTTAPTVEEPEALDNEATTQGPLSSSTTMMSMNGSVCDHHTQSFKMMIGKTLDTPFTLRVENAFASTPLTVVTDSALTSVQLVAQWGFDTHDTKGGASQEDQGDVVVVTLCVDCSTKIEPDEAIGESNFSAAYIFSPSSLRNTMLSFVAVSFASHRRVGGERALPLLALVLVLGFAVAANCPSATVEVHLPTGCAHEVLSSELTSTEIKITCAASEKSVPACNGNVLSVQSNSAYAGFLTTGDKKPLQEGTCYQTCQSNSMSSIIGAVTQVGSCESKGYKYLSDANTELFIESLKITGSAWTNANPAPAPTPKHQKPNHVSPESQATTTTSSAAEAVNTKSPTPMTVSRDENGRRIAPTPKPTHAPSSPPPSLSPSNNPSEAGPCAWSCSGTCFLASATTDAEVTKCVQLDHSTFDSILKEYTVPNQVFNIVQPEVTYTGFDYAKLSEDRSMLDAYLEYLETVPLNKLSRSEQMALWINAYNALTVNLVLDNLSKKSILTFSNFKPFATPVGVVGGETVTLENIEHDILRKEFQDPRIHAAVNCASVSCPDIRQSAFTANGLDQELAEMTELWLNNVNKGANTGVCTSGESSKQLSDEGVSLSQIFHWYAEDFPEPAQFINPYLEEGKCKLATTNAGEWAAFAKEKSNFETYHWFVNSPQ